jgi:hypothetical protein
MYHHRKRTAISNGLSQGCCYLAKIGTKLQITEFCSVDAADDLAASTSTGLA